MTFEEWWIENGEIENGYFDEQKKRIAEIAWNAGLREAEDAAERQRR